MKPTHNIVTAKQSTKPGFDRTFFTQIGVALTNDDGKMVLKLYPGTVIDWRMTESDEVTVWVLPNRRHEGRPAPAPAPRSDPPAPPLDDSDIPF